MLETLNTKHPKANKDHICQFCGEVIKKGEVYNSSTNKYDGELYIWKCHEDCMSLTSSLNMGDYDQGNGIDQDTFTECVHEAYADLVSEEQQDKDRFSWSQTLKFVKESCRIEELISKLGEREAFLKFFNMTEEDISYLWREFFMPYGMTRSINCEEDEIHKKGNHYFLQGLCQFGVVEWNEWENRMSDPVINIIKDKYPQLMVTERRFER